jgi:hypothetical protein
MEVETHKRASCLRLEKNIAFLIKLNLSIEQVDAVTLAMRR